MDYMYTGMYVAPKCPQETLLHLILLLNCQHLPPRLSTHLTATSSFNPFISWNLEGKQSVAILWVLQHLALMTEMDLES